jgi:hypothetical protein
MFFFQVVTFDSQTLFLFQLPQQRTYTNSMLDGDLGFVGKL